LRIDGVQIPKSSFLSTEKDMGLIMDKMFKNERLKRLLYYTTKDALNKPNITEDQMYEMIGKNIKTVPKLYVDGSVLNYIIISFDNFTPSSNPEFRDNVIEFDIICHFDQWQLQDFALRPYKIAAEIDSMFNGKHLTGIGEVEFLGANQMILTDEYAGLCLMYRAVHGEEDKKFMPNPADEERFLEDFKNLTK
jgi:hypothetical protein